MKRTTIEALLGVICAALMLAVASITARAAPVTITLTPQQITDIQAQLPSIPGGSPGPTPPSDVQCPDGSIHPPGYVCPVTPPAVTNKTCPGFVKTLWMEASWAAPVRMLTANYGGMGPSDIIVYTFTTGGGASSSNNLPRVAGGEYGAGAGDRVFNLSEKPCDFDPPYLAYASHGTGLPSVPFTVVTPDPWGYYPVLKFNTTYYLSVKNAAGNGCTASCDMFFDLSKNGTP